MRRRESTEKLPAAESFSLVAKARKERQKPLSMNPAGGTKAFSPLPPVSAAWNGKESKAASLRAPAGHGLDGFACPCYLIED